MAVVVEMMCSDSCWFQKVRWRHTVTNVCSQRMGKEITVSMNTMQWWVRWIKEAEKRRAVFYEKPCKWLNLGISGLEGHDLQPW